MKSSGWQWFTVVLAAGTLSVGPLFGSSGASSAGIPEALIAEIEGLLRQNRELRERIEAETVAVSEGRTTANPGEPNGGVGNHRGAGNGDLDPARLRLDLAGHLRANYAGANVAVYVQGDYVIVRLPQASYRLGRTQLPSKVKDHLKPVAFALDEYGDHFELWVEGHADRTPLRRGATGSNWTVAFERAESIADELRRIAGSTHALTVASRGDGLPMALDPFASINRRVELIFAPRRRADRHGKDQNAPAGGDTLIDLPVVVMTLPLSDHGALHDLKPQAVPGGP